jgi:hypothetical protein
MDLRHDERDLDLGNQPKGVGKTHPRLSPDIITLAIEDTDLAI